MVNTPRARLLRAAAPVLLAACAGAGPAGRLARPPAFHPEGQALCGVTKSQAHPLVVEWPSADRLTLENKIHEGVVAVRYVGCEMHVLERCTVPAKYAYLGATRSEDRVVIRDDDELYANLPVGAAGLEGTLKRSGALTVDMEFVGRYESDQAVVRADELRGDCAGATHFIYGAAVGAFDFYAGANAKVGGRAGVGGLGVSGGSQAERETLTKNGDDAACARSTSIDRSPPEGCGALVRIEVVPLGAAKEMSPVCPDATAWNGSACVAKKLVTEVECPAGAAWSGTACTSTKVVIDVQCPAGAWWNGSACAAKVVCPEGMAWLPGGKFAVEHEYDSDPSEVTVQPFCMDETEVTVDAYTSCVRSRRCSPEGVDGALEYPPKPPFVWRPTAHDALCNYDAAARARDPMNCVTWEQAESYCRAHEERLPTEWEWVWGALGASPPRSGDGADWGAPSAAGAATQGCWRYEPFNGDLTVVPGSGTCPVGGFPQAPRGIRDLEGNVSEWTSSHVNGSLVARGASWRYAGDAQPSVLYYDHDRVDARRPARNEYAPTVRRADLGFRCAR